MSTNYHRRILGEANAGGLKEFREYPLKYYDWATGPDRDKTGPMREGTAFHMALHEPERFARTYITIPNLPLRSKDNRVAFLNEVFAITGVPVIDNGGDADSLRLSVAEQVAATGSQIITRESLATLTAMVDSLNHKAHTIPRGFVIGGKKEVELRWKDPDSGVQCKALIDSWDAGIGALTDLKRTDQIREWDFKREVVQRGYDFQIAWYRRALRAHDEDPRYCGFVCGSPTRPHPWAVYEVPEERLDYCDEQHGMHLLALAECMATNTWPTINNGEPVTLQIRNYGT